MSKYMTTHDELNRLTSASADVISMAKDDAIKNIGEALNGLGFGLHGINQDLNDIYKAVARIEAMLKQKK